MIFSPNEMIGIVCIIVAFCFAIVLAYCLGKSDGIPKEILFDLRVRYKGQGGGPSKYLVCGIAQEKAIRILKNKKLVTLGKSHYWELDCEEKGLVYLKEEEIVALMCLESEN